MTERDFPTNTCSKCGKSMGLSHQCGLEQDVEIKSDEASEILALRQEIAEVEMTLGRYGRHDARCEGRALDKLPCRCGWDAVVVKYARKWEQALKGGA